MLTDGIVALSLRQECNVHRLFKDSDYFGTLLGVLESSLAVGW